MGRQPWPELELHGSPWGAPKEGKEEEGEEEVVGAAWGEGGLQEGC
jgi:hypothetical protein